MLRNLCIDFDTLQPCCMRLCVADDTLDLSHRVAMPLCDLLIGQTAEKSISGDVFAVVPADIAVDQV